MKKKLCKDCQSFSKPLVEVGKACSISVDATDCLGYKLKDSLIPKYLFLIICESLGIDRLCMWIKFKLLKRKTLRFRINYDKMSEEYIEHLRNVESARKEYND